MRRLLLATNNQGKVREYRDLLRGISFELITPASLGLKLEVAETGSTYAENARIKALAFARASGILSLADDSGLEVDALGGEPGIRSSRYAGEKASDTDRVDFLLSRLRGVPEKGRAAHFCCVIALAWPDSRVDFFSGRCDGVITLEPRGGNGFGYDPVFYFPELKQTMAELPEDVKNTISHRARAAEKACELLSRI